MNLTKLLLTELLSSQLHKARLSLIHAHQKTIKHTKPIVYISIVCDSSIDAGHELPHTIKAKAIPTLILTEGYFGG